MLHLNDHFVVQDLLVGEDCGQVVDRPERESDLGRAEDLVPFPVCLLRHLGSDL